MLIRWVLIFCAILSGIGTAVKMVPSHEILDRMIPFMVLRGFSTHMIIAGAAVAAVVILFRTIFAAILMWNMTPVERNRFRKKERRMLLGSD